MNTGTIYLAMKSFFSLCQTASPYNYALSVKDSFIHVIFIVIRFLTKLILLDTISNSLKSFSYLRILFLFSIYFPNSDKVSSFIIYLFIFTDNRFYKRVMQ